MSEMRAMPSLITSFKVRDLSDELWAAVRADLENKGLTGLPESLTSLEAQRLLESALLKLDERLSPKDARDLTESGIATAQRTATNIHRERMRQARFTFNAALSLAVTGILVALTGVALLLLRNTVSTGAITAAVGTVVEVVSAIIFTLNRDANNRLDAIQRDLSTIHSSQVALRVIGQITDQTKKDDAISELARNLRQNSERANNEQNA